MAIFLDVQVVSVSYVVRWLHVASMAGLFGGAVLLLTLSLQSPTHGGGERHGVLLVVAQSYKWLFWLALGLLVMTGVGNLGAFGAAVPERETAWGGKLVLKLAAVGAFALLSLVRTLLVVILSATPDRGSRSLRRIMQWAYASTVLLAAAILGVAVSLAHA